ncbi:MAG TPA: HNH endonuclease signature motif containing protein [Baekduia sp.]|uniref:HNH endonuclease n=1 Tax=Baekduia sp. TaxID=2600305 RepID=UPI002C065EA4|nr:HNH endonuclease signature motif containing protein [Baekduia sp.]HMJ34819.1 HNH endonuclease signature motif containing protein [Baekduia sp.]
MAHDEHDAASRIADAGRQLVDLAARVGDDDLTREEFDLALGEAGAGVVRLFGPRPRSKPGEGALWKILAYFQEHPNEWIWGDELRAVAGIGTWARRVRELRVEHGWEIEEQGDRYRLRSLDRNAEEAALWQLMNAIRRRPGSGKDRVAALLEARVGHVLTRDDLDYVAKIKEGSRRWRELRDEEGWPIESHVDEPDLQPGQYRLVSADPKDRTDPRQRLYPEKVRARVFERDDFTCQDCGRNREAAERAGDRRFYLEVHHKTAVAEQLDALPASELNDMSNLVTLCHEDHLRLTAEFQGRRRDERAGG